MATLICAVVGARSVFSVDIELTRTVDLLKDKIKEKKPGLVFFGADLLRLYLARDGDTWLNTRDEDVKALKKGEMPDRIENLMTEELLLDAAATLDDDEYFGKTFQRVEGDIHVLVECPDDPEQASKFKQQDGFGGSIRENGLSWYSSGSYRRSFSAPQKEKHS